MDKALLFKSNLTETSVDIPGRGTVRVRTMTRDELHTLRHPDTATHERKVLAACMVDPALTEDEVLVWQTASPASEISAVIDAIMKLSGLDPDAAKRLPGAGI